MARTISIYYHFDLNLTPVTLTFNPDKLNISPYAWIKDINCKHNKHFKRVKDGY